MKKLIFYSILILIFLVTCTPSSDEADTLPPDLSTDGQGIASVTVYLDGNGPPASRAMSKALALMGCDYFEVVFVGNNGSTPLTTVIGQWKIGEKAGVNGVLRGVNYDEVSVSPASGHGSALLLAGKSDKTIMGIGKLMAADTNITTAKTKVTFELAAVKTGVNRTASLSSFITAAGSTSAPGNVANVNVGNTVITEEIINGISFVAFRLDIKVPATKAIYTFDLHSGNFSTYTAGLRVMSPGTVERKYPSYTIPKTGLNINSNAIILLDEITTVDMNNNQTKDAAFEPAVEFTFNTDNGTGTVSGSIFALTFEIPVYALVDTCVWYIRPGYGVLKYELDDGFGGMGGAVLIKTGDLAAPTPSSNFIIRVETPPNKWRYRWDLTTPATDKDGVATSPPAPLNTSPPTDENGNPEWEYDRWFRITGLVVKILKPDGTAYTDSDPNVNLATGVIANTALQFYIGNVRVPSTTGVNGYALPNEFYGFVPVTVKYTQMTSGVSAEDKFFILASSNYTYTAYFDYANPTDLYTTPRIINIQNAGDYTDAFNSGNPASNKITILRLMNSFNISTSRDVQLGAFNNGPRSVLIVFVAGASGITLGRGGFNGTGYTINFASDYSGLGALYFGKWPFEGLTHSPFAVGATYPFTVNTGNTGTSTTRAYNNKWLTDQVYAGSGGGIHKVDLDKRLYPPNGSSAGTPPTVPGVTITHEDLLH